MSDIPSWLKILRIPMPATLGAVNCYLIRGPKGVALVDTGLNDASSQEALVSELAAQGLVVADVDTVFCTHHHVDHSGLGRTFQEKGAAVWMSRIDADLLLDFYDYPEHDRDRASQFGRHALPGELTVHVQKVFAFFRTLGQRFVPSIVPEDAEDIILGGIDFKVIRLSGHTPGHIGLFQPDAKIAFTGDAVISTAATHISSGSRGGGGIDLLDAYLRSLEALSSMGNARGFPGHGAVIMDLKNSALAVKSHLLCRLDEVWNVLSDEPRTAFELTVSTGEKPERPLPRWLRVSQTIASLEHLVNRGSAHRIKTDGGLTYRRAKKR